VTKKLAFASLAGVALTFVACGGGPVASPSPSNAAVEVNFATANNMLHVPEFVALEKGFYLKHGIKAKFQVFNSGAEINKAVQAGTVQIGGGGDTATPTAIAAGIPIFTFAPYMQDASTSKGDTALAVVARADSGIKPGDWSSFVGKKVGMVTGGTGDAYFRAWLAKNSVDAKKVSFQAILIQRAGGVIGYVLGEGTTQDWAKQHPDLVQNITDAMAESTYWTRTHQDEGATIATHWIQGLDPQVAVHAIKNIPYDPRVNDCTMKAYAGSVTLLVAQNKLKQTVPTEQMIVDTYALKTQKAHPEWYKDLKPAPATCPS
jgi:ABC-type nitrate/sulfonate/bicarbonate transport system substrate-binding protein